MVTRHEWGRISSHHLTAYRTRSTRCALAILRAFVSVGSRCAREQIIGNHISGRLRRCTAYVAHDIPYAGAGKERVDWHHLRCEHISALDISARTFLLVVFLAKEFAPSLGHVEKSGTLVAKVQAWNDSQDLSSHTLQPAVININPGADVEHNKPMGDSEIGCHHTRCLVVCGQDEYVTGCKSLLSSLMPYVANDGLNLSLRIGLTQSCSAYINLTQPLLDVLVIAHPGAILVFFPELVTVEKREFEAEIRQLYSDWLSQPSGSYNADMNMASEANEFGAKGHFQSRPEHVIDIVVAVL